jgi:hypothetical protein
VKTHELKCHDGLGGPLAFSREVAYPDRPDDAQAARAAIARIVDRDGGPSVARVRRMLVCRHELDPILKVCRACGVTTELHLDPVGVMEAARREDAKRGFGGGR